MVPPGVVSATAKVPAGAFAVMQVTLELLTTTIFLAAFPSIVTLEVPVRWVPRMVKCVPP